MISYRIRNLVGDIVAVAVSVDVAESVDVVGTDVAAAAADDDVVGDA